MTAVRYSNRGVVVDAYNIIEGYAVVDGARYRNVLTRNFAYYVYGLLADVAVTMVDTEYRWVPGRMDIDANREACRLHWGTGTRPPSILDCWLVRETGFFLSYPVLVRANSKYLVQWQASFTTSVTEIGVSQLLYGEVIAGTTYIYRHLLARALVSVEPGQLLYYNIEVNAPFNRNFATLLCYYLRNEDSSMVRADGASFTARTSGDVNAGPASIFVSESTHSGDPDDLSIPSYTTVPTTSGASVGDRGWVLAFSGEFKPDRDFTIRSIGIVQHIFDTGGVGRPTLLAVMPLPSPVVVRTGERRTILFRLWHVA